MSKQEIFVYADWKGLLAPELVGTLLFDIVRGKEFYSFSYANTWLSSGHREMLDPGLNLYSGAQYCDIGSHMFGLFTDSAPDRWGRVLLQRREQIMAQRENRKSKRLTDFDFFLGVSDATRMGALRYANEEGGCFIAETTPFSCPPISTLQELQNESLSFEAYDNNQQTAETKWIQQLVAPGSSLGGARPKSNVLETDGSLWIAKFPSKNDLYDIGGWEMVAHHLAIDAGIEVPEAKLITYGTGHHTYLSKRFDRDEHGNRTHFSSAMTILGYTDGANYRDGASYLDLAEALITYGDNTEADLKQLWKRIVFSICISNCDDHLRNHGFLLKPQGWRLSPAFDQNPSPGGRGLSLAIDEHDNSLNLELAKQVAPYFRIDIPRAVELIDDIRHAVSRWKDYAERFHIARSEQEIYQQAFLV